MIERGGVTGARVRGVERCRALWHEVMHPENKQFSVAEMLEHERAQAMPMPAAFGGYVEEVARVRGTCLVSLARNRYSVPLQRLRRGLLRESGGDRVMAKVLSLVLAAGLEAVRESGSPSGRASVEHVINVLA